jgi:tetratricopeptide (TPR) repeat protein
MRVARLALVVVTSGATLGAQSAESPRARVLFASYLQAIQAYQHNDERNSSFVASLSKDDFSKIQGLLQRAEPRVIETAALLHTEAALSTTRAETVDLQLALAEAALRLLPREFSGTTAFRTQWYRVVPTIYLSRRDPEILRPFIERGIRASPDDTRLRLLSGIAYEMTAQVHAIDCVGQGCQTAQRRLDLLKWTGFAVAEYRRALQLDARLVEAQLRLGRVMAMSGDQRAARSLLDEAFMNASEVSGRYLAALFLASIATDAGELPRARAHYEAATMLCPSCQTAHIALGFVEVMMGGATSGSSIERFFARETDADTDPWILYQFPQLDSMTLAALRAEARQ